MIAAWLLGAFFVAALPGAELRHSREEGGGGCDGEWQSVSGASAVDADWQPTHTPVLNAISAALWQEA